MKNVNYENAPINAPVNNTERLILETISENPYVTYEQLAEITGKVRSTVMRNISSLKKKTQKT